MTNKLHWDAESVFGLVGMPDWVTAAAIDKKGAAYIYGNFPEISNDEGFWIQNGKYNKLPLETDYEGDWKDSLLVRPERLKVGDFCKFWDDDEEPEDNNIYASYGFIIEIGREFISHGNLGWKHARKFTPRGIEDE